MPTRRRFVMSLPVLGIAALISCKKKKPAPASRGRAGDTAATVFRAINGHPAENMDKVLSLMGGVEALFGDEDVIILKPNLQWYNQGAPNIAALDRLVTLIMERKGGFRGEVVFAENIHRGSKPWEREGWAVPFVRNSDLPGVANYNGLAEKLKRNYGDRFSVCHLVDIGSGGKRVHSPADGPGYIVCDGTGGVPLLALDNGLQGSNRRAVVMSYPILKTDRGTLVDYHRGVWEKGAYTGRPMKFVNCAALNHHSVYCGVTSAIKNYLGVSDLSGGSDPANRGRFMGDYYNFHSFPFTGNKKGPVPGMLGAEVGYFLKTVRRPFLNITTAEYCGLADRIGLPVARTRAVAASTDPVALDFHTAKYILFVNSRISAHDPEDPGSPAAQYLKHCAWAGGYCYDEARVEVKSFDFSTGKLQGDGELAVRSDREWGANPGSLLKYTILRIL
jgi:hypothetical protein